MSQTVDLLQDGWLGKLPSLGYLQTVAGVNNNEAAKLCDVSPETYRRWRRDRKPPLYAFRLLTIRAGYVPWPGWEKWFYNRHDQTLVLVDLKDGFPPAKVAEFLYMRQRYKDAVMRSRATKQPANPHSFICGNATRTQSCGLEPRNSQQTLYD
jgi:hypothetical protein